VGESDFLYPGHNKAVDSIMDASKNAKNLIDFMTSFLAKHVGVNDLSNLVTVPWSVHTMLEPPDVVGVQDASAKVEVGGEPPPDMPAGAVVKQECEDSADSPMGGVGLKPLVDPRIFALFDSFHGDQKAKFLKLGDVAQLLQECFLLRVYLIHFGDCFKLIEELQVQAFLAGIGKANGALFEQQLSIDALLLKVALFKASESGVKLFCCSDSFTASSFRLEGRLPGQRCARRVQHF